MNFMDSVAKIIDNEYNVNVTENGALGFKTTGKSLLDMNFKVPSMRKMDEKHIYNMFKEAFIEDSELAIRWLFFARDIKCGLGERRLFRIIFKHMANDYPEIIIKLIPFVCEYGRFDDLWEIIHINNDVENALVKYVDNQLSEDIKNMENKNSISLLAKWMPSINTSSKETVNKAKYFCKKLGLDESTYRKILSELRKYLNVVETKMSAKEWESINYEYVPSKANLLYNSAFLRNDEDRRRNYLNKLEKGEVKINSSTLFPHDIIHRYHTNEFSWNYSSSLKSVDNALEAMWKSLPNNVKDCGNTIVVADGSGSMACRVDNKSSVTALDVANSLAIYFAEHSCGQFKNKYITFSNKPQIVDFTNCDTLRDKIFVAEQHNEVSNTNIKAVFELILKTAIDNNMTQDEIPNNILIISDMEFDGCVTTSSGDWYNIQFPNFKLFDTIKVEYENHGYKIPRLVFWNVNSRTNTIPIKENDLGVALISGFSTNLCKMVMDNETDPYKCLVKSLMNERYDKVIKALSN